MAKVKLLKPIISFGYFVGDVFEMSDIAAKDYEKKGNVEIINEPKKVEVKKSK